jgi:uncharacterized membrane protein (UPF0127 family)
MRAAIGFLLGLGLLLGGPGVAWPQGKLETFERSALTIELADGTRHDLDVELALTPSQHAQGLMYRRDLAPDAGMLFVYRQDGPRSMWMKNTYIPLDMLFLARDGRVVQVVERAVPHSLATIASKESVAAVLELNGGTVDRLGIAPGDRVLHPALGGGGA